MDIVNLIYDIFSVKISCNEDPGCGKTRSSKKVKLLSNQSGPKISRNKTKTNVNSASDQYFPIQGKTNDVQKTSVTLSLCFPFTQQSEVF